MHGIVADISALLCCDTRAHCMVCRDKAGGAEWRRDVAQAFNFDTPDWPCPHGMPWIDAPSSGAQAPFPSQTYAATLPQGIKVRAMKPVLPSLLHLEYDALKDLVMQTKGVDEERDRVMEDAVKIMARASGCSSCARRGVEAKLRIWLTQHHMNTSKTEA